MRINSRVHLLMLFMLITIFSLPKLGATQRNHRAEANRIAANGPLQARIDAQQDAEADTNPFLWGTGTCVVASIGSCLLGSAGVIGAYAYQPTPPAARFIGKNPQYITNYTNAYKAKAKRLQIRASAIGCIGGTILNGILLRIYYF